MTIENEVTQAAAPKTLAVLRPIPHPLICAGCGSDLEMSVGHRYDRCEVVCINEVCANYRISLDAMPERIELKILGVGKDARKAVLAKVRAAFESDEAAA